METKPSVHRREFTVERRNGNEEEKNEEKLIGKMLFTRIYWLLSVVDYLSRSVISRTTCSVEWREKSKQEHRCLFHQIDIPMKKKKKKKTNEKENWKKKSKTMTRQERMRSSVPKWISVNKDHHHHRRSFVSLVAMCACAYWNRAEGNEEKATHEYKKRLENERCVRLYSDPVEGGRQRKNELICPHLPTLLHGYKPNYHHQEDTCTADGCEKNWPAVRRDACLLVISLSSSWSIVILIIGIVRWFTVTMTGVTRRCRTLLLLLTHSMMTTVFLRTTVHRSVAIVTWIACTGRRWRRAVIIIG